MGMDRRYEIRLYDETLIEFSLSKDSFGSLTATVISVAEDRWMVMPLPLVEAVTPQAVLDWIEGRVVPRNRAFVDKLLSQVGLAQGDTMGLIDICLGLSLNDSYWIVPEGFSGRFADYDLYDNEFDEALALTAYTGYTTGQRHEAGLSSEWTTSGQFPKAWRRVDGAPVLYKAGTEGFANAGMEPYSEFLAAQVADAFGMPHVAYGLEMWHGRLASTCALANSREVSLVTFWPATKTSLFPQTLLAASAISDEALSFLRSLLVFDSLIANPDRHANNYGFLRDNATGRILGPAPVYDNNLSLFARDLPSDFPTWLERGGEMIPAGAKIPFNDVAALVMQESDHEGLRRLVGFSFENHPDYPIDPARLDALSAFVRGRARTMLGMRPVKSSDLIQLAKTSVGSEVIPTPPAALLATDESISRMDASLFSEARQNDSIDSLRVLNHNATQARDYRESLRRHNDCPANEDLHIG